MHGMREVNRSITISRSTAAAAAAAAAAASDRRRCAHPSLLPPLTSPAAMEGLEGELVLGLNQAPSMNAVLRALKREEASMLCCVASIAQDAQFVQQVLPRFGVCA